MQTKYLPPGATLDFGFDWSAWLAEAGNDTVASVAWTVPSSLTQTKTAESGSVTSIWLTGATAALDDILTCTMTTAAGRTQVRSMRLIGEAGA